MNKHYKTISQTLAAELSRIDYNKLPISDYNKRYIANLKPALPYFMKIYLQCLHEGLKGINRPLSEISMIDYGGGSGFLSMLAKRIGIGRVIYIDLNPNSVETITLLKQKTGTGPDNILHGDSHTLATFCTANSITPQLLIATDLIEHIYDLNSFFADLTNINPSMCMVFSTGSTPYNPYTKKRLRRYMAACENGTDETPNYLTLRYNFIVENFSQLTPAELQQWATDTRGLTFGDIAKAINTNMRPIIDPYNTCDPRTGNWVERILPVDEYRRLLLPFGYRLVVRKGFYNANRKSKPASVAFACLNGLICATGKIGLLFSPFIVLVCTKNQRCS